MTASSESSTTAVCWLRLAVLALVVAALGLPINDLFRYALLVIAAVPIFVGEISRRIGRWCTAICLIACAIGVQWLWPAPRIEEGHNVFVVDGQAGGGLERGLPADAFAQMAAEFNAAYPGPACAPSSNCHRAPVVGPAYAFSADAIFGGATYSRRVTAIDFSDPVWLRLGAINELQFNWNSEGDLKRFKRSPWWMLLHRWQLTMPYFVMYRFPVAFVGSRLCWHGLVLWEEPGERFKPTRNNEFACRAVETNDVGRRIFGVSIGSPLAMTLEPSLSVEMRRLIEPVLALLAAGAVLLLLVRWRPPRLALPFILIGLSLVVVLLSDASFIGGIRPFDSGDDGLFYESVARQIAQHAHNGAFSEALKGGEAVFYYGGPGLRYFRAAEHFVFGDTFLGYLSLIMLLPFAVHAAFRRFFDPRGALALTLIFIAVPIGAVFGTSFYQYVNWAARGFADPAAATLFLAGLVVLMGRTAAGPGPRFAPAAGAGLLFALALWLRPNLAPGAAVLLGGAGLAALWQGQFRRVAGLCVGFLPVFGMALHNWIFGGVFVLFSANAGIPEALPMPPGDYVAAFDELLRGDFTGQHVRRGVMQMARWLAGPSASFLMVPLHAAAIVVLVRVVVLDSRFDPWLRLIASATLALHPIAWFYLSYDRYYYLTWLLTLLVCVVWARVEGVVLFNRVWPIMAERLAHHPLRSWLGRVLDWWARIAGVAPAIRKGSVSAAGRGNPAAPPAAARRDAVAGRTRRP